MWARWHLLLCALVLGLGTPRSGFSQALPDPGVVKSHLVDVGGGRRLNINCVGRGSPTVLFEQGGDGLIINWRQVQPSITALTRTCFYDRAGFGYSDPPDKPITGLNVTDDLYVLLRRAKVKLPIVIVGHSIGGFYATLYADRYPQDVAGMVLVDPGFAYQNPPVSSEDARLRQEGSKHGGDRLLYCADLAEHGKLTETHPQGCFHVPSGLTPAEIAYYVHVNTRPWWYRAEVDQSLNYFGEPSDETVSWSQERIARRSFGAMPLIVLSSGITPRDPWQSDAAYAAGEAWWRAGHRALAKRSTRGEWSVVQGSRHFIQKDNPEVVIQAIKHVVEQVRLDRLAER